ncbi:response regulator transcription factor [Wenxinia marina]|uniref:Response regulator n=1 Tax=Wenxinia marina DSM 24838 TaxID=1123501 RepID=A0A0D0PDZ8_9RHOB|nr:response regulator transcription factor [Wenxinia marina]KIQ69641.1 Response regulator [Wenxinia marina DSM 24838]GGL59988.1 DNA-binding response regulator [Wenxinia marina]
MHFLITDCTWGAESLANHLERRGFPLTRVADAEELVYAARHGRADAALMDADLPDAAAGEALRRVRAAAPRLPVAVLDAGPAERGALWEAGADLLLGGEGALTSRLVALGLRGAGLAPPAVVAGPVTLDPVARSVRVEGLRIPFARLEYEILESLVLRRGDVVGRDELMDRVYGFGDAPARRAIDVYTYHIRTKLAAAGGSRDWLATERGRGFRFVLPVEGGAVRERREAWAA